MEGESTASWGSLGQEASPALDLMLRTEELVTYRFISVREAGWLHRPRRAGWKAGEGALKKATVRVAVVYRKAAGGRSSLAAVDSYRTFGSGGIRRRLATPATAQDEAQSPLCGAYGEQGGEHSRASRPLGEVDHVQAESGRLLKPRHLAQQNASPCRRLIDVKAVAAPTSLSGDAAGTRSAEIAT